MLVRNSNCVQQMAQDMAEPLTKHQSFIQTYPNSFSWVLQSVQCQLNAEIIWVRVHKNNQRTTVLDSLAIVCKAPFAALPINVFVARFFATLVHELWGCGNRSSPGVVKFHQRVIVVLAVGPIFKPDEPKVLRYSWPWAGAPIAGAFGFRLRPGSCLGCFRHGRAGSYWDITRDTLWNHLGPSGTSAVHVSNAENGSVCPQYKGSIDIITHPWNISYPRDSRELVTTTMPTIIKNSSACLTRICLKTKTSNWYCCTIMCKNVPYQFMFSEAPSWKSLCHCRINCSILQPT